MRLLAAFVAATLAVPAVTWAKKPGEREPMVVVAVGRLVVLGQEREELRQSLVQASRLVGDAQRMGRGPAVRDYLDNAANRLENAREFLGLDSLSADAVAIPKEGEERDERLADAVLSPRLIVADFESLQNEVNRADWNLQKAIERAGNPHVNRLVSQARYELGQVQAILAALHGGRPMPVAQPEPPAPPPPTPPPAPMVQPIDELSLRNVLAAIDRESFADNKVRVLQTAAQGRYFTVAQVQRVLAKFAFSSHKLQVVSILAPTIVDPQNNYLLYNAFTFQNEKDQLQSILGAPGPAPVPAPMPPPRPATIAPPALQQMLAHIQAVYGLEAQMRALQAESARYWFSADDAMAVLNFFPSPDARIRAVMILRPRVVDPENHARLDPLFPSEAYRQRMREQFR